MRRQDCPKDNQSSYLKDEKLYQVNHNKSKVLLEGLVKFHYILVTSLNLYKKVKTIGRHKVRSITACTVDPLLSAHERLSFKKDFDGGGRLLENPSG